MSALARYMPPAFQKPRFRLFAAGQIVSIFGSWIQQVALAWLVFRLTDSVFLLGLAGFLQQIPHLFIAPVAGFVIDRLPRVKLLVAINVVLMVVAMGLAFIASRDLPDYRFLLGICLFIGMANACESPARQALLGAIVEDRALLPSAIGFNSVLFNTGRMVGPTVAGVLLLRFTETWCFVINSVTFLAVIAALIAMRLPDETPVVTAGSGNTNIRETLQRLWQLPVARYLLPNASTVALFAIPLTQLAPSIATEFFGGHQGTVGLCISATGFGAMLSAFFLSLQSGHATQLRLVQVAPLVGGLALLVFSQSRTLWLSLPLLAIIGASSLATSASTNTLLQQSVGDAWRGRVIGLYFMFFLGFAPLGNLLAGTLASHIGLSATLFINGLMMVASVIVGQLRLRSDPVAMDRLRASLGGGNP